MFDMLYENMYKNPANRAFWNGKGVSSRLVRIIAPMVFLCLFASVTGHAGTNHVVLALSPATQTIHIAGDLEVGSIDWVFRDSYAGITGMSTRIRNLTLTDDSGRTIPLDRVEDGKFRSRLPAQKFTYDLAIAPPSSPQNDAFISWVHSNTGLLMLGDLLPIAARGGDSKRFNMDLRIELPDSWTAFSTERRISPNLFQVTDVADAVFAVGNGIRELSSQMTGTKTGVWTFGGWSFTDSDLQGMVNEILSMHEKTFESKLTVPVGVILLPFPVEQLPQRWTAETRGGTTILLTGRQSSRTSGMAQLGISLTHELMHLWIPNALKLTGNYDWFYEGFTLYQALRTGMELGALTFQDYTNALAKAFDAYHSESARDVSALISLGDSRWAGSEKLLYNKGMLVAFLYDLNLRFESRNKLSLDSAYRSLLFNAGRNAGLDGNQVVIQALAAPPSMGEFVRRYIENPVSIDLGDSIAQFGLIPSRGPVRTRISVSEKLTARQKALLKKLGYNMTVR